MYDQLPNQQVTCSTFPPVGHNTFHLCQMIQVKNKGKEDTERHWRSDLADESKQFEVDGKKDQGKMLVTWKLLLIGGGVLVFFVILVVLAVMMLYRHSNIASADIIESDHPVTDGGDENSRK